eukprot:TRINITY_DN4515_c0_g1_i1.p1 TRINITY_DN4515_c0_g1~~TRINITY_DN4515_c0_g1_i1.p1  ORF type:complete len:291 (-),score=48.03 TRINITY_DN4515_c0_g1_i1:475-1347(-)
MELVSEKPNIPSAQKIKMRKTSLLYALAATVLVLFLVISLTFESMSQRSEEGFLKSIQSFFPPSLYKNTGFKYFAHVLQYYTNLEVLNALLCFLYFTLHPFLAYKIILLANTSVFLHSIAVLTLYRTPKPYSACSNIETTECYAIFTGPAYNQFVGSLYISYCYMVLNYFGVALSSFVSILSLAIFILLDIVLFAVNVINAQHFIYQCVTAIIAAIVFEAIFKFYDMEIDRECLRLGFTIRSSKKHKFILMALYLAVFGAILGVSLGTDDANFMQPEWITNFIVTLRIKT